MNKKKLSAIVISILLIFSLVGCEATQAGNNVTAAVVQSENSAAEATENSDSENPTTESTSTEIAETKNDMQETAESAIMSVEGSVLDTTELFSDRDLSQSTDLTEAIYTEIKSNSEVVLDEEGVYVLKGEAENFTVVVESDDEAKVQIVLDGVSITNENASIIHVKSADKLFVTTTDSENYMRVTGSFTAQEDYTPDAVVFSKSDLTLNGAGSLEIVSEEGNGITSKDELKITGGTYTITSYTDGLEANDLIGIYEGSITISSEKDALHSENEEDPSLGNIYMKNGELSIIATDDAIHGTGIVQLDGGSIHIETCSEGIEGTYIQINNGEINLYAKDDGINASAKSNYDVLIEVNGGTIFVKIGSGDTDAFDSNGSVVINAGTIDIEATSAFDTDGTAILNGGEVTVNGEIITQITQTQMGRGKRR